jgi:hypothetical protein
MEAMVFLGQFRNSALPEGDRPPKENVSALGFRIGVHHVFYAMTH